MSVDPSTEAPWPLVRRLAMARGISVAGTAAAYICIVVVVFDSTGSTFWVGGALVCTAGLQSLAMPFAGMLADRFGNWTVMIGSDVMAGLLFTVLTQDLPLAVFLGVAAAAAIVEAPFMPASGSATVELCGLGRPLSRANGMLGAASAIGRTAGPTIGGVASQLTSAQFAFALNSVSFAASALLVMSVRREFRAPAPPARVRQGLMQAAARTVLGSSRLRLLLLSSAGAYVSTSFAMVTEPALARQFGAGSLGYGLMITGWGVGLITGSWWAGRRGPDVDAGRLLVRTRLLMGASFVLVAFCPAFWPIPLLMVLGGFGSGGVLVTSLSEVQRHSPDQIRASVIALLEAVGTAAFVLGVLIAGALAERLGVTTAYLVAGFGTLATAIPFQLYPATPSRR